MRRLAKFAVFGLLGALLACAPKVTVQVLSNGKLMLYVPKGTKVNWVDENYQSVQVTFPFANPCQGAPGTTDKCTVEAGQAIYECVNGACEDPGVGVKPTTGPHILFTFSPKVELGTAKLYQVYCDSGGNAAADGPTIHQNDLVNWVPDQADQAYTLSGFSPDGVCNPSTITNGVVCTVGAIAEATYKVEYKACKGSTTGTGHLHVSQ